MIKESKIIDFIDKFIMEIDEEKEVDRDVIKQKILIKIT